MYKVLFVKEKNGKIELSQKELERLLNEAYDNGYKAAKEETTTISNNPLPWYPSQPPIYYTNSTNYVIKTPEITCVNTNEVKGVNTNATN